MKIDEFINEINLLGIKITDNQIELLEMFYNMLIEWNKKFNLTRIVDKEDVYLKHYYDSLTLIKEIDLNKNLSLCDIGSGAGFPGIVLKIVFPNLKITLIDSLKKRVDYLNCVIESLKLQNIIALHDRAEIYAKNNREKYDIVTARAVSSLKVLIEICLPIVKVDGCFIAMKGDITEEIKEIDNIKKELKSDIVSINKFYLPKENSLRTLIRFQKKGQTDLKYPRNFDKIKKSNCKK